jgi:hypothetical protein
MSQPLIYISTWKVKDGRLDDYKQFAKQLTEIIEAKEPQLIAFNVFLNEEGTEMTSIQVHPNADSMDFHMQIVSQALGEEMNDWVGRADFIEPKHIEIFGMPSTKLLEADNPIVEAGIPRSIKPNLIAGFTHSPTG